MTDKVLVMGAVLVDVLTQVAQLPQSGADVTATTPVSNVGGCALNVFSALQKEGVDADLMVPIGSGTQAKMIIDQFEKWQIKSLVTNQKQDNGWDLCLIEPSGERTFITFAGLEQQWQKTWFAECRWSDYRYIYLSGYELENYDSAKLILDQLQIHARTTQILFDASPRIGAIDPAILQQLWQLPVIIHANQEELATLTSTKLDLPEQLAHLQHATKVDTIVVTLGGKGAAYWQDNACHFVAGEEIISLANTNGAGDAHCGGLLAGLMQQKTLSQSVAFANQLASQIVVRTTSNFY